MKPSLVALPGGAGRPVAPPAALPAPDPRADADRKPLALRIFRRYARWKVRGGLDGLYVEGLDAARAQLAAGPAVLCPTHASWWDPLVLMLLDEAMDGDTRAFMDSRNLEKLPFFRYIGTIDLDRRSPESAHQDLLRGGALLHKPRRGLWLFPQGRHRPPWLRPLGLKPGVARLAALHPVPLLPMGFQYAFREGERPTCAVSIGPALDPRAHPGEAALMGALEAAMAEALERCDAFLDQRGLPAGWSAVVPGAGSRADDGLGTRFLRWALGGRRGR